MTAPARRTATFAIDGPLGRDDLPALAARFCAVLADERPIRVVCDVAGVAPDAVAVDALARMQLAARRAGCTVVLRGDTAPLRELVAFMGLRDVLLE